MVFEAQPEDALHDFVPDVPRGRDVQWVSEIFSFIRNAY